MLNHPMLNGIGLIPAMTVATIDAFSLLKLDKGLESQTNKPSILAMLLLSHIYLDSLSQKSPDHITIA